MLQHALWRINILLIIVSNASTLIQCRGSQTTRINQQVSPTYTSHSQLWAHQLIVSQLNTVTSLFKILQANIFANPVSQIKSNNGTSVMLLPYFFLLLLKQNSKKLITVQILNVCNLHSAHLLWWQIIMSDKVSNHL